MIDLSPLLERVSPAAQHKLKRKIVQTLKKSNQKRMSSQSAPDGAKWQKRSPTSNGKGQMMRGLRRQLSIKDEGEQMRLGFFGRSGQIANTHHFGLSEQLKSGFASYPVRELIGVTDADEAAIMALVEEMIEHGL